MIRAGVALVPAGALLLFAVSTAAAESADDDWVVATQQRTFAVDDVSQLQLTQPFGDIRIEGAEVDQVIITMVSQHHREDPRLPTVLSELDDGELQVEFAFGPQEIAEQDSWSKRRIDVGVQVPSQLVLVVSTDAGRIELKKYASAATLSSRSGDIEYDGTGGLIATSEHGSIRALARTTQTDQPLHLESVNGELMVSLLEGASATVELATRGVMSSDYSTEVERDRGSRRKVGRAVVGEGRREVRLDNENGPVRLASVVVDEQVQASR